MKDNKCPDCQKSFKTDAELKEHQKQYIDLSKRPEPRVETGPTVFGNDWTGVFIRGDNCFEYLLAIEYHLKKPIDGQSSAHDVYMRGTLKELYRLLKSTDERIKTDREEPVRYEMPKRL